MDTGLTFLPTPDQYPSWQEWAAELTLQLQNPGRSEPIVLPPFPSGRLPVPNQDGLVVFVTDEVSGAQPAYSKDGNWYRFGDNVLIKRQRVLQTARGTFKLTGKLASIGEQNGT